MRSVPVPVIAAGAIADGRTLLAGPGARARSASGSAPRSCWRKNPNVYPGASGRDHRAAAAEDFIITRAYTGKTARDYRNEVIKAWDESGLQSACRCRLQGVLMDDFIAAAEAADRAELINNPAGQIAGMLKTQASGDGDSAFDGPRGRAGHRAACRDAGLAHDA